METTAKKTIAKIDDTGFNEVLKAIYRRRAVRKYADRKVSEELIDQILRAGTMAPSALNFQPWKFYILNDKKDVVEFSKEISKAAEEGIRKAGLTETLDRFADGSDKKSFFDAEDPVFHGAPVVVFLTAPKANEWGSMDIAMCAQNMMLAAYSLGLATCPIGFARYVSLTGIYSKLHIPDTEQVELAVTIGYGDDKPVFHERSQDNRLFI